MSKQKCCGKEMRDIGVVREMKIGFATFCIHLYQCDKCKTIIED